MRNTQKTQAVEPLTVSVPEAAQMLGIGASKAWEMAYSGELPTIRFGRRRVVPLASLHALIAELTEQAAR